MKNNNTTNRLTDRLMALFNRLFIHHSISDKFRILTNEKASREKNQQSLKISQSHW